ncbi:MAG: pyridoxamine 5'-phosphate oxidase family protein [Methanomassiliicoccaceae archaeon]|nr:pyridoxamine 5'-phosphate oxidase family protein [Methanomassiliicoccaceae archaeon]
MEEVIRLLKTNTVMNLATCHNEKPRSSIMEYIMVGDAMIFSTDPESIKGRNLAKNPNVSLTVGNMPVFVAIDGTVSYAGPKEVEEYNAELIRRYPMFKEMMESGAMKFKHFRVVFDTAYYSEGMGPAKIIKMGK